MQYPFWQSMMNLQIIKKLMSKFTILYTPLINIVMVVTYNHSCEQPIYLKRENDLWIAVYF
jgi:hypothetical protein